VEASLAHATWAQGGKLPPVLESAQLRLAGTAQLHALELRAVSKALPPAWTEILQPTARAAGANASAASQARATTTRPDAEARLDTRGGPAVAAPASAASSPASSSGARTVALLRARGGLVEAGGASAAGWRGSIQQLELRSNVAGTAPLLHLADVDVEALWAGGLARVTVQPGRADVLGGAVRWSRISWHAADGAAALAQIDAEIEIKPLRIAPLLARAQPGFGWGGDLSVGGHLKVHSAPTFSADVVLERRSGDLTVTDELGTQTLGLTDLRLALNAENGVWSFTQALAGKTLGVAAGAVVARTSPQALWPAADTPIEGVLELQVASLGTWGNWVPPGWRLDGALRTSASIGGRFGAPEYTGEIRGTGLGVRNFLEGVNVTDGDVSISLRGGTAHVEHFTAKAGKGTLRLEGDANLGAAPEARLTLIAEKAQILGRVDRRIIASGKLQLHLDAKTLGLSGRLGVDEGLIDFTRSDAPSLSDDVHVVRATDPDATGAPATPAAPTQLARKLTLDLRVDLGRSLRIRGHGLDTGLRGELHITSPEGQLRVNGTVSTVNGSFDAYGQKLTIDRGEVIFSGPIESPRLDIVATRPNLDVRVGVAVSGTTANPRVRLFSEPEMSEIDKLSWLVMGRASSGLGRSDTALLQRAALALLAGEGGGPTDKITQAFGLDEISVSQSDGAVTDTVISLGKQLSRRWYLGYERGLNATAGTWQLIYRIAQHFTLRLQSGLDNSVDLIWTWRWQ
jgi:translocation and assembly module TamB